MTVPKIVDVKVKTIFDEEISAVLIPMSVKASLDIEQFISANKMKDTDVRDKLIESNYKNINSQIKDDNELKDVYVEAKIALDLSKNNEETSDKRVKSLKEKRTEKLLEGKTREMILQELAEINIDIEERRGLLGKTISLTLWHLLRKKDNPKEKVFETLNDLEESLTQDDIIEIFSQKTAQETTTEEELKN